MTTDEVLKRMRQNRITAEHQEDKIKDYQGVTKL